MADLYDGVESVKTTAPGELGLADGNNGFTAVSSKLYSIRLAHAIGDAKNICKHRVERLHTTATGGDADLITAGHIGVTSAVKYQGSDHYLSLQYKECQKGHIGWFSDRQIIGRLPDTLSIGSRREEKEAHLVASFSYGR